MRKLKELPWIRITAEGVAIVVSILLAFGIQAWWDDKQRQVDEELVLTALADELDNLLQADMNMQIYSAAVLESTQRLLDASLGTGESLSAQEVDMLLADLTWKIAPIFNQFPVMNSLLSTTGSISLVSDIELLQRLAVLHTDYEMYNTVLQNVSDHHSQREMPFLERNTNLAQIANADDGQPGVQMRPYPYEKQKLSATIDHSPLLSHAEFQSMLMHKIWLLQGIEEFRPIDLDERMRKIVQDIRHTLEK